MPFVRRNAAGRIVALMESADTDADDGDSEFIDVQSPEVQAFLGLAKDANAFTNLDQEFIRVMEDLIDVLIQKGAMRLTDLPPQAQQKLLARKDRRRKMAGALDLLGDDEVI